MRKLILALAVVVMCGGLTGCYEQPPLYNYNPTYEVNNTPASSRNDINLDRPKIDSLKGKITPIAKVVSDYQKIGFIKSKTEFETSSDFENRKKFFLDNEKFKKTYFVIAHNALTPYDWLKYDVYSKRFSYKIIGNSIGILNDSESTFEEYPFSLSISLSGKDAGSYTGVNAFGISKHVDKSTFKSTVIVVTNKNELLASNNIKKLPMGFIEEITGTTKVIDPVKAEHIKNNIKLVYEFNPSIHYVFKDKLVSITKKTEYDSPTLDNPRDWKTDVTILFSELIAVHLIDEKSKEVLGSIYFK